MTVHVQENGWIDDNECIKWINKVWVRCLGRLMKRKLLLIWDMFKPHLCKNIKATIKRCNTDIAVISRGLTSVVQSLDVCLNKLFKDGLRQCWNEWMISGDHTFTDAGNMHAASLAIICERVMKSWENISVESIQKSLKNVASPMPWMVLKIEKDSNVFDQLLVITPENDLYDNQVSAKEWNLIF